jgi:hypothetical protein
LPNFGNFCRFFTQLDERVGSSFFWPTPLIYPPLNSDSLRTRLLGREVRNVKLPATADEGFLLIIAANKLTAAFNSLVTDREHALC